jgi:hypothetical protein
MGNSRGWLGKSRICLEKNPGRLEKVVDAWCRLAAVLKIALPTLTTCQHLEKCHGWLQNIL